MAITHSVKEAPPTLPPSRLYLDDLEHVIRIFQETPNAQGTSFGTAGHLVADSVLALFCGDVPQA